MQWVREQKEANPTWPIVASMSIQTCTASKCYPSLAINDAVAELSEAGVPVAAAAGNSNVDACTSSPGGAPSAITVGATDRNDRRASWSNWYGPTCNPIYPCHLVVKYSICTHEIWAIYQMT